MEPKSHLPEHKDNNQSIGVTKTFSRVFFPHSCTLHGFSHPLLQCLVQVTEGDWQGEPLLFYISVWRSHLTKCDLVSSQFRSLNVLAVSFSSDCTRTPRPKGVIAQEIPIQDCVTLVLLLLTIEHIRLVLTWVRFYLLHLQGKCWHRQRAVWSSPLWPSCRPLGS